MRCVPDNFGSICLRSSSARWTLDRLLASDVVLETFEEVSEVYRLNEKHG